MQHSMSIMSLSHRGHRVHSDFLDTNRAQSRRAAEMVLTTKSQRHEDGNKKTTYKNSLKQYFAASRLRGENRSDENISESSVPSVAKTLVAQRPNNGIFVSLCLCGKSNSVVASSCLSGSGKPSSSAALRATPPGELVVTTPLPVVNCQSI